MLQLTGSCCDGPHRTAYCQTARVDVIIFIFILVLDDYDKLCRFLGVSIEEAFMGPNQAEGFLAQWPTI